MQSEDLLPIGELARRTGVNPVTLRAWERRYGLLKPQRTAKGQRLYPLEQVERVEAILGWLQRGASVGQVRELLDKPSSTPPKGDWQARQFQLITLHIEMRSRDTGSLFHLPHEMRTRFGRQPHEPGKATQQTENPTRRSDGHQGLAAQAHLRGQQRAGAAHRVADHGT